MWYENDLGLNEALKRSALHCSDEASNTFNNMTSHFQPLEFEGFSNANHNVNSLATSSESSESAWANKLIIYENMHNMFSYDNSINYNRS